MSPLAHYVARSGHFQRNENRYFRVEQREGVNIGNNMPQLNNGSHIVFICRRRHRTPLHFAAADIAKYGGTHSGVRSFEAPWR